MMNVDFGSTVLGLPSGTLNSLNAAPAAPARWNSPMGTAMNALVNPVALVMKNRSLMLAQSENPLSHNGFLR